MKCQCKAGCKKIVKTKGRKYASGHNPDGIRKSIAANKKTNASRSAKAKANWKNLEYVAKVTAAREAVTSTKKYRDKMSKNKKKFWRENEELKEKYSKVMTGREVSEETRKKLSQIQLASFERNPERREALALAACGRIIRTKRPNNQEKKLDSIIQRAFPQEFSLNVRGGVIIGTKVPDWVNMNGKKLLIEFFGNYWHGKSITGRERVPEEFRRKAHFKKYGFSTVVIWEEELKYPSRIVSKIKEEGGY